MELAIALDALLGDGRGELRWKVGLRAARLYDGPHKDKLECRAIITAIYDLRSAVVHNGKAPREVLVRNRGKMAVPNLVEQGVQFAGRVIEAAISRGELPDWFEAELAN